MKSNKKLILAFLIIVSLIFLAACDTDTSSVINQTEAETGAQQTISSLNNGGTVDSLDQHLTDDFLFKSTDDETSKDINSLKDKFFNSSDNNLNFKIDDDFNIVDSSENRIIIASNLIVEINFSTGLREIIIPITLTLEKVNGAWKISKWEERDDSDDHSDLDQDIEAAEKLLDDFLTELANNSTENLGEFLTADFEYKNELNNNEIEFEGKNNFINYYQDLFNQKGLKYTKVSLTNRDYEREDDDGEIEVEIYGLLTVSGEINGEEFTNKGYYAEFELIETNEGWKLEEWEQEDDIDDEDDDLDD